MAERVAGGEPLAPEAVAGLLASLAARLARWWIATGRYSEAGQFLTAAVGGPAAAAPGIQGRVLIGGDCKTVDILQRLRPAGYWKTLAKKIDDPGTRRKAS